MTPEPPPTQHTARSRRVIVLIVVGLIAGLGFLFRDRLSLQSLAQQESDLRTWTTQHPVISSAIAFAIYVAVTSLSIPGASAMTLVIGWLFGFWRGLLIVSFASTMGATLACGLSRYLFRDAIQRRFGSKLEPMQKAIREDGPFYLMTLRLIPAVPFFVVNAVMGLTSIRLITFWWVSQLGMLPGTAVYVYAGSAVPKLQDLADKGVLAILSPAQLTRILVAFCLLGLLPLVIRFTIRRFSLRGHEPSDQPD